MDQTDVLDEMERMLIETMLPMVREIKKQTKITTDEKTMARNLIAKVGTRIFFGKSKTTDEIILGKGEETQ